MLYCPKSVVTGHTLLWDSKHFCCSDSQIDEFGCTSGGGVAPYSEHIPYVQNIETMSIMVGLVLQPYMAHGQKAHESAFPEADAPSFMSNLNGCV